MSVDREHHLRQPVFRPPNEHPRFGYGVIVIESGSVAVFCAGG